MPTKKNGGIPEACDDERKMWVPAGCGKCIECLNQKRRNWQVRLHEEIEADKTGQFVTLTFENETLAKLMKEVGDDANLIAKVAVKRFRERWRRRYGKSIKHWLCTELGHEGTERLHMHGILWTDKPGTIEQIWGYGWVYIGEYVNAKTINYIIKYVTKIDEDHKEYTPVVLASPGLGRAFLDRIDASKLSFKGGETIETYRLKNGLKTALPMYYRNKLWTDEERGELWTKKLDEQVRWVRGEKIEISTDEGWAEYEKALAYHQSKNIDLGYGNRDWSKKNYKKSVKNMIKNLENKK